MGRYTRNIIKNFLNLGLHTLFTCCILSCLVCMVVYCLGSLVVLVLGILLLCCIPYMHLLYYLSSADCTLDVGLTDQKPVCVYGCTLSCVS